MFRAKTVLVIGAGASVEVGLPIGAQLLTQIAKMTSFTFEFNQRKSGDEIILDALKDILNEGREVTKLNEHLKAARQLGESAKQALSIDNVIDALEDDRVELVGKLGIVRAIIKAESESANFRTKNENPDAIDLTKFDGTWYSSLTKLLTENVRKSDVNNIFENLEIVNFNYDRCLEHYLPISLASYYGLRPDAFRASMQNLVIHRPYGVAGRLPWQRGDGPSVEFGRCGAAQLAAVAQQVRTFTERVAEGEELERMRDAIGTADRIVFLGFAFHRQNVELIASQIPDHTEILATAFEISASDKEVIETELGKAFEFDDVNYNLGKVQLANMTCAQLFREYWRTLTAEKGDHAPLDYSPPQPLGVGPF